MIVQLLGDIFRCTFLDTVPMENQLSQICQNIHRLKILGHDLKDSLIAVVMVMLLPDLYTLLRQYLYMKKKSKLITEFVTKQILIEENSHGNASYVTLIGNNKRKKPSQGPSTNSDVKKNQAAGTISENRRIEGSKTWTARLPQLLKKVLFIFSWHGK